MNKTDLYKVINKEATVYKIAKDRKMRWHATVFKLFRLAIKELQKK